MGEYVKYKNDCVKIGTCTSLYYTAYQQFKNAVEKSEVRFASGNENPRYYLNGEYRFRFPFPDEHFDIGDYPNHDRGFLIKVPRSLKVELTHGTMFFRTDMSSGMYKSPSSIAQGFNLPCITGNDFPENIKRCDWNNSNEQTIFEVIMQKPVDNQLQTVVRCPYCGEMCRLSKEEVLEIVSWVQPRRHGYDPETRKIVYLMIKGYRTPL